MYQSLIFFYFITTSGSKPQTSAGKMFGLWDISTLAFTCVVVTVNLRLLLCCNSITRWHHISVWGSIIAWFLFIFGYSGIMTNGDRQVSRSFSVSHNMYTMPILACALTQSIHQAPWCGGKKLHLTTSSFWVQFPPMELSSEGISIEPPPSPQGSSH